MKILTYNAWHGLNGKGVLRHGELETPERRSRRLQTQVQKLRELAPDVAFLQEVNPLAARMPQLQRELSMNAIGQSDLCGTKCWGIGIPVNLSSGLAILAREELTKLAGPRLSGSRWTFAKLNFSFQVAETRYALLGALNSRDLGRLLVVNTHMHHGFEPSPGLREKLQALVDANTITEEQRAKVVSELESASARRRGEGRRLLDEIAKVAPDHDGIILAGDMNADPDAIVIDLIKQHGFVDIAPAGLNTWDSERNAYNFDLSAAFSHPVSDFGIRPLRDLLHAHGHRVTRLDYIFVSKNLADRVRSVTMFGHDLSPEDMPSDHFGLVAELR
jgi:endonuclease/exonuclease/phosphatase family metal-dependent hydrolase